MSVSGVGVLRLVSLFCPALLAINLLCFVTSLFHGIHGVPNRCRHMAYHELLVAFRTRPLAVLDYTSAYIAPVVTMLSFPSTELPQSATPRTTIS